MFAEIERFLQIAYVVFCLMLVVVRHNYYWLLINLKNGMTRSVTCLVGKTAIVTGGNSGIGYMTSMLLASRGCRVIIACRRNAQKEIDEIKRETKNPHISFKHLDLSRFESVRKFAEEIKQEEKKIDILINNAGVGYDQSMAPTEDGLDMIMQTNYFGHFLLTHLLIDRLKAADGAKIIPVTSGLANVHDVTLKHLYPLNPSTSMDHLLTYSNSKALIIFMTQEMAKKLEKFGITVKAADPGVASTPIFDVFKKESLSTEMIEMRIFTNIIDLLTATDTYTSAQMSLHLATSEKEENGRNYFRLKAMPKLKKQNDARFCEEIWKETEKIVKLRPEEKL